jgi:hypothetical protein
MSRTLRARPQSHAEADRYLGSKSDRPPNGYATRLHRPLVGSSVGAIALRHHDTDIVTWHESGAIILSGGGWRSSTTRDRIRACLPPGVNLHTEGEDWYLEDHRPEFLPADLRRPGALRDAGPYTRRAFRVPFTDGTMILPDASLHGRERLARPAAQGARS